MLLLLCRAVVCCVCCISSVLCSYYKWWRCQRSLALELRTRALTTTSAMPETVTQTASPLPSAVFCSGAARQCDPTIFSGTDDTDVEDWLASYERVSAYNKWDDSVKLTNVIFYLSDVANLWFRNHEADISSWAALKTSLTEVFGRPAVRKLRAEQRLRSRAQQTGENFTSYTEDAVDLCKCVNPSMSEADKIRHIMKGIEDDAFQMLVAKDPQTVSGVIGYCQSFDELRKQRLSTRHAGFQEAALCSLALPGDGPLEQQSLLQSIQQFVREEVARQLSLSTCPPTPAPSLTPNLQRVIEEQVAEVLPPPPEPPLIAAPLTYADAVVRSRPLSTGHLPGS
ncbi:uncharacterized protein LOC144134566 [Amblyomma americanum]